VEQPEGKLMTDDIAALINDIIHDLNHDAVPLATWGKYIAKALYRLTTPPPPEKIAGLIERAYSEGSMEILASALAQENERIRELEAELAEEKELNSTFNMLAVNHCLDKHKVEAERDAIRAKTFEECANVCDDQAINADTWQERKCAKELGDSIRALKEAK
jgi:hypothetical protein